MHTTQSTNQISSSFEQQHPVANEVFKASVQTCIAFYAMAAFIVSHIVIPALVKTAELTREYGPTALSYAKDGVVYTGNAAYSAGSAVKEKAYNIYEQHQKANAERDENIRNARAQYNHYTCARNEDDEIINLYGEEMENIYINDINDPEVSKSELFCKILVETVENTRSVARGA
jgi:hypothetical protein